MRPIIYSFLDNLGHCRFSEFSSSEDPKKKLFIEMIGRFAVGVLALFSLYDVIENALPSTLKIVIHGPLIAIIASLGLSILLKPSSKKSTQINNPKKNVEEPKKEISKNIPKGEGNIPQGIDSNDEEKKPHKSIKRNLLNEFNACEDE